MIISSLHAVCSRYKNNNTGGAKKSKINCLKKETSNRFNDLTGTVSVNHDLFWQVLEKYLKLTK